MIMYNDEALEKAIKGSEEIMAKLCETKPNDDLALSDIESAIYYIRQFHNECVYEKFARVRKQRRTK